MAYELLALSAPFLFLLALASVWSLIWKGIALWTSARNSQMVWFIVFLFFNTLGIIEIIYLIFFSSKKQILVKKRRKR